MNPQELSQAWERLVAARVEDSRLMGRQCWLDHKGLAYFCDADHGSWIEARQLMDWADSDDFRAGDLLPWANRFNWSVKYLQAVWLEGYYSARLNELLNEEASN